jgi:type II secretory pathway pseudopilin PulG
MSGGTIGGSGAERNNADGDGVYFASSGTFTMSGGARINANNDVYLVTGSTITISGDFDVSPIGTVATITLPSWPANGGTQVLTSSTATATRAARFALTQSGYSITSDGKLARTLNTESVLGSIDLGGTYILTGDITLSNTWTGIGITYPYPTPPDPFTGTFDGNGHTITLGTPPGTGDTDEGVFRVVGGGGVVKNLKVGGTINSNPPPTNVDYAGAIVGYLRGGTITNCASTADISITDGGTTYAGGIAGRVDNNGTISGCYSTGAIETTSGSTNTFAGGIAGWLELGTIENCYSTGAITGTNNDPGSSQAAAGGIVGQLDSPTIRNCYAIGAITGYGPDVIINIGGIAGKNKGYITHCVAANPTITADTTCTGTKNLGRVWGLAEGGGYSDTNYADEDMTLDPGTLSPATVSGGTAADKNGADTPPASINSTLFFTTLGWSTAIWDNSITPPRLKNAPY